MSAVGVMSATAMVRPVTLEGRFVRLEPLTPAHAAPLLAAASGSRETYGLTLVPGSAAETAAYIETALAEERATRSLPFATVDRASGRVVGSTRFLNIEFWTWPAGNRHQRGPERPDVVEIGATWLAASAQRTPINTEAKLLMLTHAFEKLGCVRVELRTDRLNEQSRAAIQRIGAREEGTLRKHAITSTGRVRDDVYYSILDEEWPDVKANLLERRDRGAATLTAPRTTG
jgi:RimJ/RimL family protein N-acetyltransferase